MVNRLIFLFYLNVIKLKYDDRFGFHIFSNFHVDEFKKMELEIPKEHKKIEGVESIKQEIQNKWNDYDKFWRRRRVKFVDKIIKDIFENDDLFFIFADGFMSLSNAFTNRPTTIKEIDKKFAGVLIKKGINYGLFKVVNPKDSDSGLKN